MISQQGLNIVPLTFVSFGLFCKTARIELKPVHYSRLVQIVRGHLHLDPIADGQPDKPFPHFARDMGQYLMPVI